MRFRILLIVALVANSAAASAAAPEFQQQLKIAIDSQNYEAADKLCRAELLNLQGKNSEQHAQLLIDHAKILRHLFQFADAQKEEQEAASIRQKVKEARAAKAMKAAAARSAPMANVEPAPNAQSNSQAVPNPAMATSDLVYIPENIPANTTHRFPALIILSPFGDPRGHIATLKPVAYKYHWILVGDGHFQNGVASSLTDPNVLKTTQDAIASLPIDPTKVYIGGLSGGAMGSYDMVSEHPELYAGVVANTGMMRWGSEVGPPQLPENFPTGKSAVMIASPSDFRYGDMQRNKQWLEQAGWAVKWMEFEGGHNIAPARVYDAAFEWLSGTR